MNAHAKPAQKTKPFNAAARVKLAQLLGMTTSDFDGEALNAARAANKLVSGCGMSWTDIIVGSAPKKAKRKGAKAKTADIRTWCDLCRVVVADPRSAPWEKAFCNGLLMSGKDDLTRNQISKLREILQRRRKAA